jgi:hypothetical protein
VCFSAFNVSAAFKKQHVQPIYEKFNQVKAALDADKAKRATGQRQGNAELVFDADFRLFAAPSALIETLKDLVFKKISAQGRPLALVAVLEQSFNGVKDAVMKRDALAQRFESGAIPQNLLAKYYFGIRLPSGHTDHEFPCSLVSDDSARKRSAQGFNTSARTGYFSARSVRFCLNQLQSSPCPIGILFTGIKPSIPTSPRA